MLVNEIFSSVQGEGPSVGMSATFLRLQGCNLACPFCDSKSAIKAGDPLSLIKNDDVITQLSATSNLVITGGEPLLQQEDIVYVLERLEFLRHVEIETNGTIAPSFKLLKYVDQFNISPKLHDPDAYNAVALFQLNKAKKVCYKFVIKDDKDFQNFESVYRPGIPADKIWLMPEGSTVEELNVSYPYVLRLVQRYNYHLSPRLHIERGFK